MTGLLGLVHLKGGNKGWPFKLEIMGWARTTNTIIQGRGEGEGEGEGVWEGEGQGQGEGEGEGVGQGEGEGVLN